jgi:hypothetical protein
MPVDTDLGVGGWKGGSGVWVVVWLLLVGGK